MNLMQLGSCPKIQESYWLLFTKPTVQQSHQFCFVKLLFHNVVLTYIVEYNENLKFDDQKIYPSWVWDVPR